MAMCKNCKHRLYKFANKVWLHRARIKVRSKWKNISEIKCTACTGKPCTKPEPM